MNAYFHISSKYYLALLGGIDYYFANDLSGHDTTYRTDGEHINPREQYGYRDADKAIYQPKVQLRMMIGISYKLN